MIRATRTSLVFLLVATVGTCPDARGQDVANQEEAVEEGHTARQRYMDRIELLRAEIDRLTARPFSGQPGNGGGEAPRREKIVALGRLHALVGQYDHAADLLLNEVNKAEPTADLDAIRELLGRLYLLQGRYPEMEELLDAARFHRGRTPLATLRLAQAYFETGRKTEGLELCRGILEASRTDTAPTAPGLLAAGFAAKYLERSHEANNLLSAATRVDAEYIDAYVAWGRLFLEKYNRAAAAEIFEDALKIEPDYPPALIGLAETLAEKQPGRAEAVARKSLAINPGLAAAHHFLAGLFLTDEAYDEAIAQLRKALEFNPESPETHALLAACYHGQGRRTEYEASRKRVFDINPAYGRLYEVIAVQLTRRYRFREAVEMGRKAIETDASLWSAYAGLGINMTRVAEMEEGRRMLDRAFDNDPFNTRTYNTLELLDSFEDYETRTSDHFTLKIHRDEDAVYGQLALELLEEAHRTISPRYGFVPEEPVLVEILPDNDDFMVRIAGVPGTGGLLGVCFGEVVVANSPRARPKGTFNWGQTLWHEYVHVVHLQQTRNRIPRWLAEGIAVYETRIARPEWDIDLEAEFADATVQGILLPVSDLNRGFTRPKSRDQVILSYYQASIVVEHIVDAHGFEAIRRMLKLYNENRSTGEVVRTVFDLSMDDFDRSFADYAEKRSDRLRSVLRFKPPRNEKLSVGDLDAMAADNPESFFAHLMLGQALHTQERYEEAIAPLERARSLYANYVHPGNAYELLGDIYLAQGNVEAAMEVLEALTAVDEDDIETCRKLALLYAQEGRRGDALRILERAVMIDPFDGEIRKARGGAYEREGIHDLAVPEYEAVLAVETTDTVQAHYDLARAYLASGRKGDARKAALKALEIAPDFEAAQDVLLQSLE